ncbi:Uncharacterised protein [Sphingobacterium mizutaii]|uniref:Uncharacterized protein n=1 Tax=Sphingobacterium mizutaii TaxID=1010 RepID=A0AAJ4XF44_9SPHI|nr:Uncharacterised protein [Sphingobacterium mizutaii]
MIPINQCGWINIKVIYITTKLERSRIALIVNFLLPDFFNLFLMKYSLILFLSVLEKDVFSLENFILVLIPLAQCKLVLII